MPEIHSDDVATSIALIAYLEPVLSHFLAWALQSTKWEEAQAIAQPLLEYLNVRGKHREADEEVDRVRRAVEGLDPEVSFETPAGALWLFVVGSQAARATDRNELDRAERTYREIGERLQRSKPSATTKRHLATTYHQLGAIVQRRGNLHDATTNDRWNSRTTSVIGPARRPPITSSAWWPSSGDTTTTPLTCTAAL